MLSRLYPEFKISTTDAENAYNVPNINRKCEECGKPFAIIGKKIGQMVRCPECGVEYVLKNEIKISVVIERDPEITPGILQDFNKYLQRYQNPENYRLRVLNVINMAASGATTKEIHDAVKMSNVNVGSAKTWGRQRGLC